jgi:hypothetical protein
VAQALKPKFDPANVPTRQRLNRRLSLMRAERSTWEQHWKELGDNLMPRDARFYATDRNKGVKKNGLIIDSTGPLALRVLASGLMGGVTSPSRQWFTLRAMDPDLNEQSNVKLWLDQARVRMAEVFLRSNLYTVLPAVYQELGAFGTSAFAVEEDAKDVIRCKHFPLGSYSIAGSARGVVDAFAREYQMTVATLVQKFGYERMPKYVRDLYERRQFDTWIDVVHFVEPSDGASPVAAEAKGKLFVSTYYLWGGGEQQQSSPVAESEAVVSQRGFEEFPVIVPRWTVVGEDVYGSDCPGMLCLGDIKQLQLEQKKKLQAIGKMVNPPVQAPASLKQQRISLLEGDITYYDSANGAVQKVEPVYAVDFRISELAEDIRECQERIKRTFFEDMFLMLDNLETKQPITAAEVAERKEEKLLQLGPALQRLNDELLDPLIRRTFGIMLRSGVLPPLPPELNGQRLSVEYESILAQAVKLTQVAGIQQLTAYAGSLVSADPGILDNVDLDEAVQAFADAIGVPPKLIRDATQVAKLRASREQQQRQQQMLANAQNAAQVAQTLSQTPTDSPSALTAMGQAIRGANA